MCNIAFARFGVWAFYVIDVLYYIIAMFYSWIKFFQGEDKNISLSDAILFTILVVGFWILGYYSTLKRNYFGSHADWATDTERRCMYIVCLPTGLLLRNQSSDPDIRNYTAPFELHFWWLFTIYNASTSILIIIVAFIEAHIFNAFWVAFMLGLYLWAYYTLTTHARPVPDNELNLTNIPAADQREIVYGRQQQGSQPQEAVQLGTSKGAAQNQAEGTFTAVNVNPPAYQDPPAFSEHAKPKIDFEPIQINDDKGPTTRFGSP